MVLCVEEKTQIQALDKTQPLLTNETKNFFAALDVATGEAPTQCRPHNRHQEFLGFLRHMERSVHEDLDDNIIVNKYCTNKHALNRRSSSQRQIRAWLEQHPCLQVNYHPTYVSWLNQVERRFGVITQRAIRRGSFSSFKELNAIIEQFRGRLHQNQGPLQIYLLTL